MVLNDFEVSKNRSLMAFSQLKPKKTKQNDTFTKKNIEMNNCSFN